MKKFLLSFVVVLFALAANAETRRYIWQNDGNNGPVSWNGVYRFSNVQTVSGEELYAISMADWALIKEGVFYMLFKGNQTSNVRITTGWWSGAYGGPEHNCIDMAIEDPETGLMSIAVNIKEDGNLYNNLDAQHLLFTGSDYTPMAIYVVEGASESEDVEVVKTSLWKNGEQSTIPGPVWSGEGRFARESSKTGEETYAFPDDVWETLKAEPFRIAIEVPADSYPNVRITTGWWTQDYGGKEFNCFEIAEPIGDGIYSIELKLSNYPVLLEVVDVQHLLFTGDGYKLLEIYKESVTGVKEILVDNKNAKSTPMYNIVGQRITAKNKGLYIRNGKKYLVK